MNLFCCSQEKELQAMLLQGRWPHTCDPDLHAHVENCRNCQEVVLVTQTLQRAKSNGERLARLESPGLLWWRAELRRRREAIQTVTEPLAVAERVGLLGLLAAFCVVAWQGSQSADFLNLFQRLSRSGFSQLGDLWGVAAGAGVWMTVLGIASLGALAFFAGFAIFLLRDEG